MDKICIKGGVPLEGVIPIGGAKNAALPLMAASLLTSETLTLKNVPVLADIATMANLLVQHGCGGHPRRGRRRFWTRRRIVGRAYHFEHRTL